MGQALETRLKSGLLEPFLIACMEIFSILQNDVLLNYYSFGSLLSILAFLCTSLFFLFLKEKSSSTMHLALGALFFLSSVPVIFLRLSYTTRSLLTIDG